MRGLKSAPHLMFRQNPFLDFDNNRQFLKGDILRKKITTAQALKILQVSGKTLERRKQNGLHTWKVGRDSFFFEDDIIALVSEVRRKQLTHAPDAIEKKIKKQKEVEAKGKEIEKKLKEADDKPKDELLDDNGKQHLIELKTHMEELGIYEKIDDQLIFTASLAFQLFLKFEALAMSIDFVSVDVRGIEREHPYADIAKKHFDRYLTVCERMWITPLIRKKMKAQSENNVNEFAQFFI